MKKIINNVKTFLFWALFLTESFVPNSIKSNYLASALYKHKQYNRAEKRLKNGKENVVWINIKYLNNINNIKFINGFFYEYSYLISSCLVSLNPCIIVDYLKWQHDRGEDIEKYTNMPCKAKTAYIVLWCVRILKNKKLSKKIGAYNAVDNIKSFIFVAMRLGVDVNIGSKLGTEPEIEFLFSEKENKENAFFLIFSNIEEHHRREKTLRYLLKIDDRELVERLFYKYKSTFFSSIDFPSSLSGRNNSNIIRTIFNPKRSIINYFYEEEYKKISIIWYLYFYTGLGKALGSVFNYIYLSLFTVYGRFPYEFISFIERQKLDTKSYLIFKELAMGNIRGAEIERRNISTSLQSFLDSTFEYVDLVNIDLNNDELIFIAESGVADEVRWARLYSYFNKRNVSISCDPRLYNLFSSSFPNINFISHKRLFRGNGTPITTVHQNNIPKNNASIRLSTSMMFLLVDEKYLNTNNNAYVKAQALDNIPSRSIGIMWSSSYTSGIRGLRYALSFEDFIPLIELLISHGYKIYSLQSPLSEEDREKCYCYGVNILDELDLYNDFDKSARFYKSLNAVVGPSSLNTELAAAVGTDFYHIANQPEIISMRNGNEEEYSFKDQLSNNTISVYPLNGYKSRSKKDINKDCITHAAKLILSKQYV